MKDCSTAKTSDESLKIFERSFDASRFMQNSTPKPLDTRVVERFWLALLLLVVLVSRIPFLDMGFGRSDAWRIGVSGKFLVTTGEYSPSRPPGFPLIELASAMSYAAFQGSPATWTTTNSLTCLFFLASIIGIWMLAKRWDVKYPILIAVIYSFAPLNWVYSVETIDYLWMSTLLIFSIVLIEGNRRNSSLWGGILLGIATSARFLAFIQLIPILMLMKSQGRKSSEYLSFITGFLGVVILLYSIVLLNVKDFSQYVDWFRYLNKVTSGIAELEGGVFVRRFLIPAARLFGPSAWIVILLASLFAIPKFLSLYKSGDRGIRGAGLMCLFIMAPYLWHLHQNYWIPAIGFLLILLGKISRPSVMAILGAFIIAANFPAWQSGFECGGWFGYKTPNLKPKPYALEIGNYQNENIFIETRTRLGLLGSVEELLSRDLPSNWIIMVGIRLPIIQFLVRDIQLIELPLKDGGVTRAWGSPSGGARYKYLLSPSAVADVVESGYHAVYLPGMESMYYAENRVQIFDVPGVEILTYAD